ncbi:MAG: photosystem II reaction center protein Ycf12 [Cyanobacteria bacterium J06641_5]
MELITNLAENPLFALFVQLIPVFLIVVAGPVVIIALFYLKGDL